MKKVITLGCRLNFYESEIIKSTINSLKQEEETIVINTCAVTAEAERQSKQAVRKCIKENPKAKIIVTGCAAQIAKKYFENLEGVFSVIPNDKKNSPEVYKTLLQSTDSVCLNNNLFADRARAFIQIQNGCNNYCSFCIVPFTRGPSVSLPIHDIINSVAYFINSGLQEIVLSGVDIVSYGKDLNPPSCLADVLRKILEEFKSLNRIRISSIDPSGFSDKLFELIANEKRIMPHLHLSIQSGDNEVLKIMRRRYSRQNVIDFCQKLKTIRKEFVFGADFIAGFPGETESMFGNTIKLIDEAKISLLHVFPYSIRPGTLAATFIQNPKQVIQARAEELRNIAFVQKSKLFKSFVGKQVNFIVEKTDNNSYGKTDHFLPIKSENKYKTGELVYKQTIKTCNDDYLLI
jgi:threonylcarbamoyladenosine tRNA methylthiotransferase MtaB